MIKRIIPAVAIFISLISCSNYRTVTQSNTTSITPDEVRLNLSISDFEYLGKTEISSVSRRYFGFVNRIDSVNNQRYNFRLVKEVELQGDADIKIRGVMRKAAYKVIEEFPDADFYLVGKSYSEIQTMFLGKKIWRTMEIYAYKYKR